MMMRWVKDYKLAGLAIIVGAVSGRIVLRPPAESSDIFYDDMVDESLKSSYDGRERTNILNRHENVFSMEHYWRSTEEIEDFSFSFEDPPSVTSEAGMSEAAALALAIVLPVLFLALGYSLYLLGEKIWGNSERRKRGALASEGGAKGALDGDAKDSDRLFHRGESCDRAPVIRGMTQPRGESAPWHGSSAARFGQGDDSDDDDDVEIIPRWESTPRVGGNAGAVRGGDLEMQSKTLPKPPPEDRPVISEAAPMKSSQLEKAVFL